jgi:hypothetical protein
VNRQRVQAVGERRALGVIGRDHGTGRGLQRSPIPARSAAYVSMPFHKF